MQNQSRSAERTGSRERRNISWSDLLLSRTMLTGALPGLRGSFRLRLASTFNHRPDPNQLLSVYPLSFKKATVFPAPFQYFFGSFLSTNRQLCLNLEFFLFRIGIAAFNSDISSFFSSKKGLPVPFGEPAIIEKIRGCSGASSLASSPTGRGRRQRPKPNPALTACASERRKPMRVLFLADFAARERTRAAIRKTRKSGTRPLFRCFARSPFRLESPLLRFAS